MDQQFQSAEKEVKQAWKTVTAWVGGAAALIGSIASLYGAYNWFRTHHADSKEHQAKMALAQSQMRQGEYQASVQTYSDILKSDSLDRPALDGQLAATELWAENFSVTTHDGQSAGDLAGPSIDQILVILDAGLLRSKGPQAADVQAHIGWTHWLNQRIADREFGSAAEQGFRAALATDPSNVYANAMLGNWLVQNNGDFKEAVQHFDAAVATGKARPFVRELQLGALINLDKRGARAAVVRAANDMRKTGEPLTNAYKNRILGFCFDPIVTHRAELGESLSAVPPDDVWQTYLWLDRIHNDENENHGENLVHDFIQANLLEVSGRQPEALARFRTLQKQLSGRGSAMRSETDAAIARLSRK